MMKRRLYVLVLVLLPAAAYGQTEKPSPSEIKTKQCSSSPFLDELFEGKGVAVLKAYGYDPNTPWNCTTIDSPWTPSSSLLHFQIVTTETDEFTSFSVINVNGSSYFWVIPTGTGMVGFPHEENDPHNIAAFNALLGTLARNPSSAADWNALGELYLVLLDQEGKRWKLTPGSSVPCDADRDCTVEFSDKGLRGPKENYIKWTLLFHTPDGSHPCRLVEASRKVVKPPAKGAR